MPSQKRYAVVRRSQPAPGLFEGDERPNERFRLAARSPGRPCTTPMRALPPRAVSVTTDLARHEAELSDNHRIVNAIEQEWAGNGA